MTGCPRCGVSTRFRISTPRARWTRCSPRKRRRPVICFPRSTGKTSSTSVPDLARNRAAVWRCRCLSAARGCRASPRLTSASAPTASSAGGLRWLGSALALLARFSPVTRWRRRWGAPWDARSPSSTCPSTCTVASASRAPMTSATCSSFRRSAATTSIAFAIQGWPVR